MIKRAQHEMRADCALCGKRIAFIAERWTHLKDGWQHTRQRHTATPKPRAEGAI